MCLDCDGARAYYQCVHLCVCVCVCGHVCRGVLKRLQAFNTPAPTDKPTTTPHTSATSTTPFPLLEQRAPMPTAPTDISFDTAAAAGGGAEQLPSVAEIEKLIARAGAAGCGVLGAAGIARVALGAFPQEFVWGVGCDLRSQTSVMQDLPIYYGKRDESLCLACTSSFVFFLQCCASPCTYVFAASVWQPHIRCIQNVGVGVGVQGGLVCLRVMSHAVARWWCGAQACHTRTRGQHSSHTAARLRPLHHLLESLHSRCAHAYARHKACVSQQMVSGHAPCVFVIYWSRCTTGEQCS